MNKKGEMFVRDGISREMILTKTYSKFGTKSKKTKQNIIDETIKKISTQGRKFDWASGDQYEIVDVQVSDKDKGVEVKSKQIFMTDRQFW